MHSDGRSQAVANRPKEVIVKHLVKGWALARPSERSERFEPFVSRWWSGNQSTCCDICFDISTIAVLPVNSNFTFPTADRYISSSESRSKVPEVSTE